MKSLIPSLILLLLPFTFFAQPEPITADSEIKGATVYLSGAKIYHESRVTVPAGVHEVILQNLTNQLDLQSLQVSLPASVTLLSTTFRQNYFTPKQLSQQLLIMRDSVDAIQLELELMQNKQQALQQEQELILANKQVGGTETGLNPEKLQQVAQYFNKRLPELKNEMTRLRIVMKAVQERLRQFQQQIAELNENAHKPSGELILQVSSSTQRSISITFSYLVYEAGWTPAYDIRGNDISSPLMLTYKANVYQNTGLDWTQVPLIISTGNPVSNQNRPVLYPWYIDFYDQQYRSYNAAPARQKNLALEEVVIETDDAGYAGVDAYTAVQQNQLNVEFQIDLPYTVPSDGKTHVVAMKEYELPATYTYHAVPKLDQHAFLLAKVTDWQQLNLLAGQANIFFENSYIGQTHLNPDIAADTMLISLGRDQSIVVKREQLRDFSKKSFLGGNVKQDFVYEISVRNNKNKAISIEILENIPISRNKDIEVELEEHTGAEYTEETGKLMWNLQLDPGETEKLRLEYSVKYPKGKVIPGL